MPTALEKGYVFTRLDELEPAPLTAPGATDDGRRRFDLRRRFDITSFGVQAVRAPSGVGVINAGHAHPRIVEAALHNHNNAFCDRRRGGAARC